jgi:hypothetical protein
MNIVVVSVDLQKITRRRVFDRDKKKRQAAELQTFVVFKGVTVKNYPVAGVVFDRYASKSAGDTGVFRNAEFEVEADELVAVFHGCFSSIRIIFYSKIFRKAILHIFETKCDGCQLIRWLVNKNAFTMGIAKITDRATVLVRYSNRKSDYITRIVNGGFDFVDKIVKTNTV